jgi:hypothetical protein
LQGAVDEVKTVDCVKDDPIPLVRVCPQKHCRNVGIERVGGKVELNELAPVAVGCRKWASQRVVLEGTNPSVFPSDTMPEGMGHSRNYSSSQVHR